MAWSRARLATLGACALAGVVLVGGVVVACRRPANSAQPRPGGPYAVNVVHHGGLGPIKFGDNRDDLLGRKVIEAGDIGCGGQPSYGVPGHRDAADLVFDPSGKLVLIWVLTEGVATPDKLTIHSPVDDVRKRYPKAEELAGTRRSFPALLAVDGQTALLFLYDPDARDVVKILAGYAAALRDGHKQGLTC